MKVTASWTSITLYTGKVIPITKVTAVDAHSVHYSTEMGGGAVEISDLPDDVQKSLGYDPQAAAKAIADLKAKEAATDALVAQVTAKEQAEKQQVYATPAQPITNAGAPASAQPSLTPAERASIQNQIAALQDDINFMQGEEAKLTANNVLKKNGAKYNEGSYAQKIIDEQAQMQQLQSQLR